MGEWMASLYSQRKVSDSRISRTRANKIPWRRTWKLTPVLAWRIPWTEEPGVLQFIVSQRVSHDWSDLACMQAGQIHPDVYFCKVLLKDSQACAFTYQLWLTSHYSDRHMEWLWQIPMSWQSLKYLWAFLVAQMVKNLPAMQQTRVWSLKKGMHVCMLSASVLSISLQPCVL